MEITDELVEKITAELWRRLAPETPPAAPGEFHPPARGRRRVLTEAEVRAACPAGGGPGQTLSLAPGDILTPLARDYIQNRKIDVSFG